MGCKITLEAPKREIACVEDGQGLLCAFPCGGASIWIINLAGEKQHAGLSSTGDPSPWRCLRLKPLLRERDIRQNRLQATSLLPIGLQHNPLACHVNVFSLVGDTEEVWQGTSLSP